MAEILRSKMLHEVPHGFSARSGLTADDIKPNGHFVHLKQVHSADVRIADKVWPRPPEGDALVTRESGLILGIVTADCAPVLLADTEAGVVGAAHAGWRGAVGNVLGNTVRAMCDLGASVSNIRAAIGPTIALASYEVDERFRQQFELLEERFFRLARPGHFHFDLPGYVAHQLDVAGVRYVDDLQEDTYTQPKRFCSFRRSTHLGEATQGRQLSAIALPD